MKAKISAFAITTIFLVCACNKGQYTTKPQLSLKSVNTTTLSTNQLLEFNIQFTDKEGDVQDTLWIQGISKSCHLASGVEFVKGYQVPNFDSFKNIKGIFDIKCLYNGSAANTITISGCSLGNKNDTCNFKFWLKDLAGNISDTLTSPDIVLLK